MRVSQTLVAWSALAGVGRVLTCRTKPVGELRYHVPTGHDAAAALAAVRTSGLRARIAIDGGFEDIVIVCDPTDDRERVRSVLRGAPTSMGGQHTAGPPITFADEESD